MILNCLESAKEKMWSSLGEAECKHRFQIIIAHSVLSVVSVSVELSFVE